MWQRPPDDETLRLLSFGCPDTGVKPGVPLTYEDAADRTLPLTVEHTQTVQASALGHTRIPAADHTCQVGAMALTLACLINQHRDRVREFTHPMMPGKTDIPPHR